MSQKPFEPPWRAYVDHVKARESKKDAEPMSTETETLLANLYANPEAYASSAAVLIERLTAENSEQQERISGLLEQGKRDYATNGRALAENAKLKERIAELTEHLQFVERWAVHYASKPGITAEQALGMIQHYPPIKEITRSYTDGVVPETFDPYARIAELEAVASAKPPRSLHHAIADAIRPYLDQGERVIFRAPFRWLDQDGRVLSNHYEHQGIEYLAQEWGYEIVHNFNHVAVIKKGGANG